MALTEGNAMIRAADIADRLLGTGHVEIKKIERRPVGVAEGQDYIDVQVHAKLRNSGIEFVISTNENEDEPQVQIQQGPTPEYLRKAADVLEKVYDFVDKYNKQK